MLLTTFGCAVLLLCVLAAYYALERRAQNIFLIIASYFFYCWWDWRFAGLLIVVTLINYCGSRFITLGIQRKTCLWVCVACNLAILGFFKYYNFFVDTLAALFHEFGMHAPLPGLSIILPIGISFYTFQSIAFVVDVYRKRAPFDPDFITVAAFTSFFPQLLAGPIERAENMLPQYRQKRIVSRHMLAQGLLLIFIGLFKKVAIADVVAPEVNTVFNAITTTPWPELVGGLWYFTIQLYCDFSGYSDIARGVACLLGFNLMLNFKQPFLARNISDYWRRWHISLSNWLRDYLYIPLGGSRGGLLKTCRNIMVTMLICGLWHGANWTFIIWGALNGAYLVLHRVLSRAGSSTQQLPHHGILPAITYACSAFFLFNVLLIPWLFFRADSVTDALAYMQGIFFLQGTIAAHGFYFCKLAFFVVLVFLIDIPQFISRDHAPFLKWHWALYRLLYGIMLIALYGIMVTVIILSKSTDAMPFIYFQF